MTDYTNVDFIDKNTVIFCNESGGGTVFCVEDSEVGGLTPLVSATDELNYSYGTGATGADAEAGALAVLTEAESYWPSTAGPGWNVTAGGSSGTGSGGGGSVPSNNSAPTISGTDTEGDVLTATTGSWSGSPTSYAYQWEDCNSSGGDCADVASGGTASTYTLTGSDVGDTIVVEVTATNGTGSSSPASSVATSVVASTSSVEVAVHNWFHGPNCGGGSTCTITPTFETAPATLSGSLSQSGTDYGFSNFFFGADYFEFSGTPGQQLVLNFTNSTDEYDPPGAPWPPMYYEFFDGSGNTVGYGEVYDAEGFNGACETATADQPPGDYNGFGACEATFGSDGTLIVELENGDVVPYAGVTASITG